MNKQVFFWSLTSALAGFLFGFDTVVISGAEQTIQALWGLSAGTHGVAMASALYGTVIGSMLGGWPTDRFGRKLTLLGIGILYIVSAAWSALATDVYSFIIARMIGGVGIGISTVVAPLYISEIAPAGYRGRLAFDLALARWVRRKYKRLSRHRHRSRRWVAELARREPHLFAHWRYWYANGRAMGAV